MKTTLLVAALTFLPAAVCHADVLVVDAAGGGSFTQIQPAVDAAIDGDTLLVKSGSYASFVVANKALKIVGDTASDVQVIGAIRVRNLATNKVVVLQNLKATGVGTGNLFSLYGTYLDNNSGRVRIEACAFVGAQTPAQSYDAIRIESCADVCVTRTSGHGGAGSSGSASGTLGGAGLYAQDSIVTIYDAMLSGGDGQVGQNGGIGGRGALASGSVVFASGSSFVGGHGGNSIGPALCFGGPGDGGDGGTGLLISGGSTAELLGSIETGGHAGSAAPAYPCSNDGLDGTQRESLGGTFTDLSGNARHLVSESPLRESTTMTLTFTGTPGDQVTLLLARKTDEQPVPAQSGVLLVGTPTRSLNMGVIPAGGTLTKVIPVFALGSIPSITLYVQARFTDAQLVSTLSGPGTLAIVNQSF